MRVQHNLGEMVRWRGMSERNKELCVDEARNYLRGVQHWPSIYAPDRPIVHVGDGRFEPTIEYQNDGKLKQVDKEILQCLNALRRKGVKQPLTPFYVAVWGEAMSIPDEDLNRQRWLEPGIILAMVRVQGTAMLVGAYNAAPGNAEMKAELVRRGLLRR